jgi:hypothetical protein
MLLPLTPVTGGTKDELAMATRDSGIGFLAIVPCRKLPISTNVPVVFMAQYIMI